jgi:hypothetical protein
MLPQSFVRGVSLEQVEAQDPINHSEPSATKHSITASLVSNLILSGFTVSSRTPGSELS